MSKELTPLKALKELKKRYGKNFSIQDDNRMRIVESALKEYKDLKQDYDMIKEEYFLLDRDYEKDIKPKLTAFELFRPLIQLRIDTATCSLGIKTTYVLIVEGHIVRELTKEEYELLKKVVL